MITHPASILFFMTFVASILYTISAESWLMAWIGLEVNLLSFIPMKKKKKNKYSAESALKYFLIQALASMLIITSACWLSSYSYFNLLVTMSLLLKSGAAPSHQWLPAVAEGATWPIFSILMTLQKVNPLVLIFFTLKTNMSYYAISLYALASAIIGSLAGLSQNSLRKIFTYSSIAHMSWILSTLLCTSWLWFIYFLIYTLIIISLVSILELAQMSTLNHLLTLDKSYLSFIISASILSLSGLPPFTGVLPKLMAIQLLAGTDQVFMILPLLTGTFVSLFFYTRLLLTNLMLTGHSMITLHKISKINFTLLNVNLAGLLVPTLVMVFL
nr:TPA_asm: ND2 [Gammarus fossarum]